MPITTPVLSYLQDSSKTLPMLLIEGPTTLGRTYQGYKRGGEQEGREKICEETLGAVVWLFGVKSLNKIGDVIGEKVLGLKDLGTDVGKDSLRNPFAYVTDKKGLTAAFKFTKIVSSAVLGTLAMGMVVPKIKMAMTNAFRIQAGLEPYPDKKSKDGKFHPGWADKLVGLFIRPDKNADSVKNADKTANISENKIMPSMEEFVSSAKNNLSSAPSFKGAFNLTDAVLYASHNLENNTAWRLLSTDLGTLTGRVANSRTKKEAIEYGVRDSISSLFYIFAAPIFSALLRKITQTPDIHPKGAEAAAEKLKEAVRNQESPVKAGFFSSKFKAGEDAQNIFDTIIFNKDKTITLDEFNRQTASAFKEKADLMSKLQPELINSQGIKTSILSEKQVGDILSDSELSDPVFLKKAISDVTNGKSDDAHSFVSRKRLEKIRDSFDDFARGLEKYSQKAGRKGVIDEELINKYTKSLNRKNLAIHLAGIGFAVLGLAVLIPKFQYWVSEKITGEKDFLGENEIQKPSKTDN